MRTGYRIATSRCPIQIKYSDVLGDIKRWLELLAARAGSTEDSELTIRRSRRSPEAELRNATDMFNPLNINDAYFVAASLPIHGARQFVLSEYQCTVH